jgi:hypothetical protein
MRCTGAPQGAHRLDVSGCAAQLEILMDIIAILEIGATAALLVAHLAIVVRNRFSERT